jgi:D-glycero-D-manno-heptose 1,7-bisphosphate phosphatase
VTLEAKRAVILDRDGTVVVDRDYLDDPEQLEFLPGALQGLRLLHERGHPLVVVTNQSGVARLQEIHARLLHRARAAGAPIDAIYYCPHRPEEDCECRKPKPKLVLQAAAELGFEPAAAVVIGDKSSDVELGHNVGAVTMLVSETGRARDGKSVEADYVIHDLIEAARLLAAAPQLRPRGGAIPGR